MKNITLLIILFLTSYFLNAQNTIRGTKTETEKQFDQDQMLYTENAIYLQELKTKSNLKGYDVTANTQDSLALVALYKATDGDNWINHTGWLKSKVADWYGISLDINGRVVEIFLYHNNLNGKIPQQISNLTMLERLTIAGGSLTEIPLEICDLTALKHLDLSQVQLTSIPKEIGKLINLTLLDLSQNQIAVIPSEIGNLNKLTSLYLAFNQLTSMPIELKNLTSISTLVLSYNHFSQIPLELFNLTGLVVLGLNSNQLIDIPIEINNLGKLVIFYINDNLIKSLPAEINNLIKLKELYLENNQFESLPNLSGLTLLTKLSIENNALDFGDLQSSNLNWSNIANKTYSPQAKIELKIKKVNDSFVLKGIADGTNNTYQWFKNDVLIAGELKDSLQVASTNNTDIYYCKVSNIGFPDLILTSESFYLSGQVQKGDYDALVALYNATNGSNWTNKSNWLSNNPVSDWYGIGVLSGRVNFINLDNNNLEGTIPTQIGNLTDLTILGLNNGKLSGAIPSTVGNLSKLISLGLSGNLLSGNVPDEIAQMENLENLLLFNNQLIGLPDLSVLKKLQILSVGDNKLTFEDLEPNIGLASLDFSYAPRPKLAMQGILTTILGIP